jgi:hypothetical protein
MKVIVMQQLLPELGLSTTPTTSQKRPSLEHLRRLSNQIGGLAIQVHVVRSVDSLRRARELGGLEITLPATASWHACPRVSQKISSLADYFAVISSTVSGEDMFWFRGHSEVSHTLVPSSLRMSKIGDRLKAYELMAEFKRVAVHKLERPPVAGSPAEDMEWAQIAQHYGLPTRLLDWTESATTALYFACEKTLSEDGIVFLINPAALNRWSFRDEKLGILDPRAHRQIINKYLTAKPTEFKRAQQPVAVNPVWNTERLIVQRGKFTLHGRKFGLNKNVPTLLGIPILKEAKQQLRSELQRIGVDEMTLYPELEHSCNHLKRLCGLASDK